jgi:hypothetical protein
MKIEPTPFDLYVRRRLEAWGREFRLDRDVELLGYRSKDMLQVLIEHKGEMPERSTGFRPLTIPPLEMQIEDIVHDIHRDARHLAVVLRAFYCGSGRAGVERLETAEQILGKRIRRQQYYAWHDLGFHRVAGALSAISRAA